MGIIHLSQKIDMSKYIINKSMFQFMIQERAGYVSLICRLRYEGRARARAGTHIQTLHEISYTTGAFITSALFYPSHCI